MEIKMPQERPGAKPKYNWDEFFTELVVRADLDGLPETQAELQREMAQWCTDTWGEEPGESMISGKIRAIYKHPRKTKDQE